MRWACQRGAGALPRDSPARPGPARRRGPKPGERPGARTRLVHRPGPEPRPPGAAAHPAFFEANTVSWGSLSPLEAEIWPLALPVPRPLTFRLPAPVLSALRWRTAVSALCTTQGDCRVDTACLKTKELWFSTRQPVESFGKPPNADAPSSPGNCDLWPGPRSTGPE